MKTLAYVEHTNGYAIFPHYFFLPFTWVGQVQAQQVAAIFFIRWSVSLGPSMSDSSLDPSAQQRITYKAEGTI